MAFCFPLQAVFGAGQNHFAAVPWSLIPASYPLAVVPLFLVPLPRPNPDRSHAPLAP